MESRQRALVDCNYLSLFRSTMTDYGFLSTHCSVIAAAKVADRGAASEALRRFCQIYYEPVFRYIQTRIGERQSAGTKGYSGLTALDLTHDFFAQLLDKGICNSGRIEGRFRYYLLGQVKHFLGHVRERERAQKRGAGLTIASLSESNLSALEGDSFPDSQTDAAFDRDWANALIESAIRELEVETPTARRLVPFLTRELTVTERQAIAEQFQLSDAAIKVALSRLRKRFRLQLRKTVAESLGSDPDPEEIDDELDYLITALRRGCIF